MEKKLSEKQHVKTSETGLRGFRTQKGKALQ